MYAEDPPRGCRPQAPCLTPLHDVLVLGAGLSGLTCALEAARGGFSVCVLERAGQVGGLARTLEHGGYRFDLGGHRFHTKSPAVETWLLDLMGPEMLTVPRRSHILMNGRFVDYPLRLPNVLLALGPARSLRIAASYVRARCRRNGQPDLSMEDWVVRRFGRALFEIYFQPYTEKVWGLACSDISSDWASSRIRVPTLGRAVAGSLLRALRPAGALLSHFRYPESGFGAIPDRIAQAALATGRASLHLGNRVTGLRFCAARQVWEVASEQGGVSRAISARSVVSTIPVHELARALRLDGATPPPGIQRLDYRGVICVLLAIEAPRVSADTWTYLPDSRLIVGRSHEPRNWSPRLAPEGKTSLCVEIFCSEGDSVWHQADAELMARAVSDLASTGLIRREQVSDAWLVRVPDAYPVHRVGYAADLKQFRDWVAQFARLRLLGRTGGHEYLNADAVIEQAIEAGRGLPTC